MMTYQKKNNKVKKNSCIFAVKFNNLSKQKENSDGFRSSRQRR